MSYERYYPGGWQSGPSGGTPMTPEAFNHIEEGLMDLDKGKAPAIESTDYPGCYYRIVNDVTEWINPPMLLGVEYRTTERWNGDPVYAKVVTFGYMPNSSAANVEWAPDSGTVAQVVRYAGTNDQGDALPYVADVSDYRLAVASNYIVIATNRDKSSVIAYVAIWYTKN